LWDAACSDTHSTNDDGVSRGFYRTHDAVGTDDGDSQTEVATFLSETEEANQLSALNGNVAPLVFVTESKTWVNQA
jgi:hypothetical protein